MSIENNSSSIVRIQVPASSLELTFSVPSDPNLDKRTLKSIHDAWTASAGIDQYGAVWVALSRLHIILRTNPNNARYNLDKSVKSEYKKEIDGEMYVKGTEVCRLIDNVIQAAGSRDREKYAGYSESVYKRIRDSGAASLARADYYEKMNKYRRELKRARIALLSLTYDELTNESLAKEGEFSHIRSVATHWELADKTWNGLVVNKKTHKIITKKRINDEEQLFNLCSEYGWSTDWYSIFIEKLNGYHYGSLSS